MYVFKTGGMKTQTELGQVRIIRNVRLHWNCPPVPVKGEDDIHLFFRQFKVKHLEKKGGRGGKALFSYLHE